MIRRKKVKLAIFSLFLAALLFLSFSLLFASNDDIKIDNLKINVDKLKRTLESQCPCRIEKIRIEALSDNLINVQVLAKNDSLLKSYNVGLNSIMSCRAYETLRRGRGQKVLSYSVFGSNPFYFRYLKLIARTAKRFYPDWIVRFYHDASTATSMSRALVCELECLRSGEDDKSELLDNVDFCSIDELAYDRVDVDFGSILPTIWRWLCIGDDFVDIFVSRDSDFCVVERDREAVDDWLKSNKLFHVMRDHPLHDIFMLAGLWGFRVANDRSLGKRLFARLVSAQAMKWYAKNKHKKDADQIFLEKYVRLSVETSGVMAHDSFHCGKYPGSKPFPKQRPTSYYCHVGGYGCCGPQFLNASFPNECPYECRPSMHKEWVFC